MKAFLLDVKNLQTKEVEISNLYGLDDYYRLIGCDCIDLPMRTVGGKKFMIVCDDEGLLKEDRIVSAVDRLGNPMLVGNLIFVHCNSIGETVGLDDEDIKHLKKYVRGYLDMNRGVISPVMSEVEYGY